MDILADLLFNNEVSKPVEVYSLTSDSNHTINVNYKSETFGLACRKEWTINKLMQECEEFFSCDIGKITDNNGEEYNLNQEVGYIKKINIR